MMMRPNRTIDVVAALATLVIAAAGVAADLPYQEIPGERELSNRWIVQPKSAGKLMDSGMSRAAAQGHAQQLNDGLAGLSIKHYDRRNQYVIAASESRIADMLASQDYAMIEPDWLLFPMQLPNDPLLADQWYIPNIGAPAAWDTLTNMSAVTVAVCDSGIELEHPDLADRLVCGYNSADEQAQCDGGDVTAVYTHGTHVAGCVVASGNNGEGISGVLWNANLMPIRVTNRKDGVAYLSDITDGALWAAQHGARVMIASYAGGHTQNAEYNGIDVRALGGLTVWAAGNHGMYVGFDRENTIVVAATDMSGQSTSWSNRGPAIDVAAPGSLIMTTHREDQYGLSSGTSYSAPITGGVLAFLFAIDPSLTPQEAEAILFSTAVDIGPAGEDDLSGHGRVDLAAAAEYVVMNRPPYCVGDVDANGMVDLHDLADLLPKWGPVDAPYLGDADRDSTVDVFDLLELLSNWGACQAP